MAAPVDYATASKSAAADSAYQSASADLRLEQAPSVAAEGKVATLLKIAPFLFSSTVVYHRFIETWVIATLFEMGNANGSCSME